MALTISGFSIASVLLAAAFAQSPTCPTAHVSNHMPGMAAGCNCTTAAERTFPVGTHIYAYDQYVVLDGHLNEHFSIKTRFWCDSRNLHVFDASSGIKASFSLNAQIIRLTDGLEVSVLPGKAMPSQLKHDLNNGLAHFKTIVGNKK